MAALARLVAIDLRQRLDSINSRPRPISDDKGRQLAKLLESIPAGRSIQLRVPSMEEQPGAMEEQPGGREYTDERTTGQARVLRPDAGYQ